MYLIAAEQGYAHAQYNLAVSYANGEGVAIDDAKAIKFYELACDQGHTNAQYNLGIIHPPFPLSWAGHLRCLLFPVFPARVDSLNTREPESSRQAEQGCSQGCEVIFFSRTDVSIFMHSPVFNFWFLLGVRYENGRGVQKDLLLAVKYYELAADPGVTAAQPICQSGHVSAQYNMALIYFEGMFSDLHPRTTFE